MINGFNFNLHIRPETYKTILKEKWENHTEQVKIRRKMRKKAKIGIVTSKRIPLGKRLEVIHFAVEKEYFIVFSRKNCYYCENISSGKSCIELKNAYRLYEHDWKSVGDIQLNISEVIECF